MWLRDSLRWMLRVSLCWGLCTLAAGPLLGAPRPLTPEERYGAMLALEYLDRGPAAWWERLDPASPLRALGQEAALEEIEARAGVPEGATWTLQTMASDRDRPTVAFTVEMPSGLDDALRLELVENGAGGWRLHDLRCLAELGEDAEAPAAAVETPRAPTPPARTSRLDSRGPLAAMTLAIVLLGLASWWVYRGRSRRAGLTLAGAAGMAGLALLTVWMPPSSWVRNLPGPPSVSNPSGEPRLGPLLPLRRALARDATASVELPAGLPPSVAETAQLWQAQALLLQAELSRAEEILHRPAGYSAPLAELLQARLGFLRLAEVDTMLAWEDFLATDAVHDGLLLEAVGAASLLGFEDRARTWLERAQGFGARSAELYYTLAELSVLDDRVTEAVEHFETAFTAHPRERADLLGEPLLSFLVDERNIQELLDLGSPEEPTVGCRETSAEPLTVPARFEGWTEGQGLRLRAGSTELYVPGGCGLAPSGTPVRGSMERRLAEEWKALDELPELLETVGRSGALLSPSVTRKLERAAEALAQRARWSELVELTDPLPQNLSALPPELVWLRAEGLRRTGQTDRARRLLIELAKRNTSENRADPVTLYRLADLFTSGEELDLALRLTQRANSLLPFSASGDRVRRIRLEQRLASGYLVERTPEFELRFPLDWSPILVRRAVYVLEQELARLKRWIPVEVGEPFPVHFLPVDDFRMNYAPDFEVVGLYDGKIRLPFGEITSFHPILVSILTHELAHAMITEATGDRAPPWLHEGLAQHVQMLQGRLNPIGTLEAQERYLAFPLLDAAIGSAHPLLTSAAYEETTWVLHYVEHHHGLDAVHQLLDEFSQGRTTREALQAVFGKTPEEFDRSFRRWATEEAPEAWPIEIRRYDLAAVPE